MGKLPKDRHNKLDLCRRAAEMVKAAGFEFHCASRISEACYYRWPTRFELLRIAAHGKDADWKSESLGFVASKITFNGTCHDGPDLMRISEEKIVTMVALGIGQYFMICGRRDASNC